MARPGKELAALEGASFDELSQRYPEIWRAVGERLVTAARGGPPALEAFVREAQQLAALLGDRPTVELAAGDGTLARFLRAQGANIRASDDQSWKHVVAYPPEVEKADAANVLTRDQPRAVVCSFPPPGNPFEKRIFRTASVELYIVITTRHRFAAGDWEAYQQQDGFDWGVDEALSRLVLPPEVDPAVLVFRRR